jgi:hypothetical protein
LDDIRPLRALAKEGTALLDKPVQIYPAPHAYLAYEREASGTRCAGDAIFAGENRETGALLTFSLKELTEKEGKTPESDSVKVEITNASGEVIRNLNIAAKAGMNRFYWKLDRKGVRNPDTEKKKGAKEPGGIAVLSGEYTVKVTYNVSKSETKVEVLPDPRFDIAKADMLARDAAIDQVLKLKASITQAADQLREASETIDMLKKQYGEREDASALLAESAALKKETVKLLETLITSKDAKGIVYQAHLPSSKVSSAMDYLQGNMGKPNATELMAVSKAEASVKTAIQPINTFFETTWKPFQEKVKNRQMPVIKEYKAIEVGQE